MKKLILLLAIFLYPLQAWSLSEEGIKEFSQKAILDCDNYGSESCGARFMAMGACTYFISNLAATMNYGLGSDDPEELAYYNKIKKEMDDMKKEPVKKGIPLNWDAPKGIDK